MKSKFFTVLSALILLSCGSGETVPELTPEEQDLANKKQEAANQLNFGLGMADFDSYISFMRIHLSEMEYATEDTGTSKKANENRDDAKSKFDKIIKDSPSSLYSDSAKIYLDSIVWYEDYFDVELQKVYDK